MTVASEPNVTPRDSQIEELRTETSVTARTDTTATPELPSARLIARRVGLALLAAGAGFALLTSLPGLEQLPAHLAGADPVWIAFALLLEIASTLSFVFAFHGSYDRRVHPRASAGIALAMQGMNILLPAGGSGGLAVGAVMMDRAGVPRGFTASRTIALFLVTSLVSFAAIVVAGLGVATGLLDGEPARLATLVPALGALLVIAAVVALPRVLPRPAGTAAASGRVRRALVTAAAHAHDGVDAGSALLRGKDPLVIWGSLGYFAFDVAALATAFHAIGADGLPIGLFVLAYTLGHAGSIIPLPGSSEGGLIAAQPPRTGTDGARRRRPRRRPPPDQPRPRAARQVKPRGAAGRRGSRCPSRTSWRRSAPGAAARVGPRRETPAP
jgi:hypothetical protein